MSATRTAACIFCGRTAPMRSGTAAVQLNCRACGSYEMTIGAISQLRADSQTKAAVLDEIHRQHAGGVKIPRINDDVLQGLKKP